MEKVTLIDFTLEDDSLLPSTSTADNRHSQPLENNLPLSPTLVSGMITCIPKEQKQSPYSGFSGSMDTSEIDMLKITDINMDVKPSFGFTNFSVELASNPDATCIDGEQLQQHGRNMNAPGRERLEAASRALSSKGMPRQAGKKKTRSVRSSSQLRKSLAWDKAFSTDEGVLDLDELPFVTKTPRKLPELQPLDIPAILGFPSPTPTPEVDKALPDAKTAAHGDGIGSCPAQEATPSDPDHHPESEGVASFPNGHMASVNVAPKTPSKAIGITPSNTPAKTASVLETKVSSKSDKTRLVPATQIIKADVLKGTRLKLPGTFTGKKEKVEPPTKAVGEAENNNLRRCKSSSSVLSPSSAGAALSKKVSSVSKKVKNTLGKVAGAFGGSSKAGKLPQSSGSHHVSGPLDAICEDPDNSREALPITKSKSSRAFVSGTAAQATVQDPRKEAAQTEKTTSETTASATLESGMIVSNLKASSKMKNVGLLMSLYNKAGPSSKKPSEKSSEKSSFYSTKVSPVFSRKKSGAAAPTAVPTEKLNSGAGAQSSSSSSKGLSSGLRLPSPKMGFFDSARMLTGEQLPSLPSSDTSNRRNPPNGGLPPKPKQGAPSAAARRVEQQAHSDKGKVASTRSGISSAAPQVKRQKAWGSSATTATHSPQKRARGFLSPPSSKQAAAMARLATPKGNVGQPHNNISDEREGNEPVKASKKLVLDASSDEACDLPQLRISDNTAQLAAAVEPPLSNVPATTHEADVESDSAGEEEEPAATSLDSTKTPSKQSPPSRSCLQSAGLMKGSITDDRLSAVVEELSAGKEKQPIATSLDSAKTPSKQSPPSGGCLQSAGLIKESITDGRLSAVVEELSPGSKGLFGSTVIDSVLCREEAGSVIDALTTSHVEEPRISNKPSSPLSLADDSRSCQGSADIGVCFHDAHSARGLRRGGTGGGPASEVEDRSSTDMAVQEAPIGMDNLESRKRSLDRPKHERDKADPATAASSFLCERSIADDSAIEDIVIHDVAEVMMGLEDDDDVVPGDSENAEPLGEGKTISAENSAIKKEQSPQSSKHLDGQQYDRTTDANNETDHAVGSPFPRSDRLPVGGAEAPLAHVKQEEKKSPPTSGSGRRTVGRTISMERVQEMSDIIVRRTSPVAATDCQASKSPLAANAGLLNSVGGTRPTNTSTSLKKEGQLHVMVDDHFLSETEVCDQENRRSSEGGGAGNTQKPQKSKQRKPFSTQNLDRSPDENESSRRDFLDLFSEERLRALEAAGEETLQKKSGAVQHSPPQKSSPNRNPWSPVKKIGKQPLGPFDCTKKYTSVPLGE